MTPGVQQIRDDFATLTAAGTRLRQYAEPAYVLRPEASRALADLFDQLVDGGVYGVSCGSQAVALARAVLGDTAPRHSADPGTDASPSTSGTVPS